MVENNRGGIWRILIVALGPQVRLGQTRRRLMGLMLALKQAVFLHRLGYARGQRRMESVRANDIGLQRGD